MGEPGARSAQLKWLSPREARLLQAARDLVPAMRARAGILDRDGGFPSLDFGELLSMGALTAVIPIRFGGLGLGIDRGRAGVLFDLLRIVGRGNLAVGRIFEGHVNAFKLISLFGNAQQIERAARDLEVVTFSRSGMPKPITACAFARHPQLF